MHIDDLFKFWSGPVLVANAYISVNILGGLILGLLIGYERTYHGRAAGMRTYGLVCMASTALVVFVGWTPQWYGTLSMNGSADATNKAIVSLWTSTLIYLLNSSLTYPPQFWL